CTQPKPKYGPASSRAFLGNSRHLRHPAREPQLTGRTFAAGHLGPPEQLRYPARFEECRTDVPGRGPASTSMSRPIRSVATTLAACAVLLKFTVGMPAPPADEGRLAFNN